MISYKIPDSLDLKVYKDRKNKVLLKISNNLTYVWFVVKDTDLSLEDRVVVSNKKTTKCLKRAILSLKLGYKRTLILKGVGFRGWLSDDTKFLFIKVSSSKPNVYKLPSDISLNIERNNLIFWSYNVTLIDNFIKQILLKTPAPKNSIQWK